MEWEEEEEENEELPKTKKKMNPAGNMISCCSFLAYYLIDLFIQCSTLSSDLKNN